MKLQILSGFLALAASAAPLHAGNTFLVAGPTVTNMPGGTVTVSARLFEIPAYSAPKPFPGATVHFAVKGYVDVLGNVPEFPAFPAWKDVVTDSEGFAQISYSISPLQRDTINWYAKYDGDDRHTPTRTGGTIEVRHPAVAAPSNLQAVQVTHLQIALVWTDNATNEDRFVIYRRGPTDAAFFEVGQTAANVTTFVDRRVKPESTYAYYVMAVGLGGMPKSTTIRATTLSNPPPRVPLQQPANGAKNVALPVKLIWTTVARAAFYEIEIAESTPTNVKWVYHKDAQNTATGTYTLSNLTRGRTYYWRVRAADKTGHYGDWANQRRFTVRN